MTWRLLAVAAPALAAAACQPAQLPPETRTADVASSAPGASAPTPPPPVGPLQLELTWVRRCKPSPQPRRVSVSAASRQLTVVDEAGEARQDAVSPGELATLADALRQAQFLKIAAHAGKGRADGCTVTISAGLDGAQNTVEESSSSQVDAAWAEPWKRVQAAVEALTAGHR